MEGDVYQTNGRLQSLFKAAMAAFGIVFPRVLYSLSLAVQTDPFQERAVMIRIKLPTVIGKRIFAVLVFGAALSVSVSAYTVVMRGGRSIEIPNAFVVTSATLTYETAPGIQVTLQLAAIDISATERANNERPGSLLGRRQSPAREQSLSKANSAAYNQANATARRTITNGDLESSARRRRESEAAYELRRKELGLPAVTASRPAEIAVPDSFERELEQRRVAERESEAYWRERANGLRAEIAALDAELSFVRGQLEAGSFGFSNEWSGGVLASVPFISFGNFGGRSHGRIGSGTFGGRRPGIFIAPGGGAAADRGRVWGGGQSRGQVFGNRGGFSHGRTVGLGFPVFAGGAVWASGPVYDYSYERGELITRFNQLAAARAGLNARWRELEDEARRAGAPPGWLRQ